MSNSIEPPVLISRLMTFVCAAAAVTLGVLLFALWRMFPLDRPQVFFLTTQLRPDIEVRMYSMPAKSEERNIRFFKENFIKEYIRARNEIVPDADAMQAKWGNDASGIVNAWSSEEVYQDFVNTAAWRNLMRDGAVSAVTCTVEFPQMHPQPRETDRTWAVPINYICTNSDGQTVRKDYTIVVSVEQIDKNSTMKLGDRMTNPLGVRVVRYEIEDGDGDPLN